MTTTNTTNTTTDPRQEWREKTESAIQALSKSKAKNEAKLIALADEVYECMTHLANPKKVAWFTRLMYELKLKDGYCPGRAARGELWRLKR